MLKGRVHAYIKKSRCCRVIVVVGVLITGSAVMLAACGQTAVTATGTTGNTHDSWSAVNACAGPGRQLALAHGNGQAVQILATYSTTAAQLVKWDETRYGVQGGTPPSQFITLAANEPVAICYFGGNFTGFPMEPPTPGATRTTLPYRTLVVVVDQKGNATVDSVGPSQMPFGPPPTTGSSGS